MYPDEGHSIYAVFRAVRAFMHPSGDYNKNVGEDSTQWGRYLNSNYVYIRARYFFFILRTNAHGALSLPY